jgi:hypothetical protein
VIVYWVPKEINASTEAEMFSIPSMCGWLNPIYLIAFAIHS